VDQSNPSTRADLPVRKTSADVIPSWNSQRAPTGKSKLFDTPAMKTPGKATVELHDECTAAEEAVDFVADGREELSRRHALRYQRRHSPQRVELAVGGCTLPSHEASLIPSSGGAKPQRYCSPVRHGITKGTAD
jgi:hypothetical protein